MRKVIEGVYVIDVWELEPVGYAFDSNIYVFEDEDEITLIDTGTGFYVSKMLRLMEDRGLKPSSIRRVILTHAHFDHSGGLLMLMRRFSFKVYAHEVEAKFLEEGNDDVIMAGLLPQSYPPVRVDVHLREGSKVRIGDYEFRVLHTPGHTAGSMCLYDDEYKVLVSGDTVFSDGAFGRVDLPTGDKYQLINSLKRLSELDVEVLLPGHMNVVTKNARRHIRLAYETAYQWRDYL
ncbi:MAG: MBL fold metallo-hydrolase [Candidatus Baldrarchaeia archaeon]